MKLVYVFPGQGSQRLGMGEHLFDRFRSEVRVADEILGYSVEELCLRDPDNRLDATAYTQPALYVVNSLHYLERAESGRVPDYVAGHSLGEYTALLAAGAFDFSAGLRLVQERARLMATASGGAMAAIMGLPEAQIRRELERCGLHGVDIGNLNSPTQIVISGPRADVTSAASHLAAVGDVHVVALRVSAAFHSRYMARAAAEFFAFLRTFQFGSVRLPVLSNVTSMPYEDGAIAETLAAQIASPVRWTDTVQRILAFGDEITFEEIGPGKTLTALIRQIRAQTPRAHMGDASMAASKAG